MLAKTKISASRSCAGAGSKSPVECGAGRAFLRCRTCGKLIYFGTVHPRDASGKLLSVYAVPNHLPRKNSR